jgi:hypothetical protein
VGGAIICNILNANLMLIKCIVFVEYDWLTARAIALINMAVRKQGGFYSALNSISTAVFFAKTKF